MLSLSLKALKASSEGGVDVGEENCYYNTAVKTPATDVLLKSDLFGCEHFTIFDV